MQEALAIIKLVIEHGPAVLSAIVGVLSALIALFLLIPGPQPEKALQQIVDVLARLSRK